MTSVLVVGQTTRDLVLRVDAVPGPAAGTAASERVESYGGKGANQAVALAQLGVDVRLLSTVGDDTTATTVLDALRAEGVDVESVLRRGDRTGLIVELVDDDGGRFILDLPDEGALRPEDVASTDLDDVHSVLVQLAGPTDAPLAAARRGREAGVRVVLDGAPADPTRTVELLGLADVVRADADEADVLLGRALAGPQEVVAAAAELLGAGPDLVLLAVRGGGNAVARRATGGSVTTELLGLPAVPVTDTTGAGDAMVAGLTAALVRGRTADEAARCAVRTAAATVGHVGARPRLTPAMIER
jgi:ribokinase